VTAPGARAGGGPVVETHDLGKRYGSTVALEGVSLRVEAGEVFGLLGPNGAGKTTLVKLLLGLTRPSHGQGQVLGRPLGHRDARANVGYLPELFRYPPWLSAREVLALHWQLAELPTAGRSAAIASALERVGLADRADGRVSGFSKGMQQRLGLAVALLGDPRLVILDEPTSALDPVGREEVRRLVREAQGRGSTVVLNTHLLREVERVCDRVAILDQGRLVAEGAPDALAGEGGVRLRVTGLADPSAVLAAFAPVAREGRWLALAPLADERIPDVVAALVAAGARVHAVEPTRPSLEDAFLAIVRPDEPPGPGSES
jgi:ABC-2 type transport system ATP-binding protein